MNPGVKITGVIAALLLVFAIVFVNVTGMGKNDDVIKSLKGAFEEEAGLTDSFHKDFPQMDKYEELGGRSNDRSLSLEVLSSENGLGSIAEGTILDAEIKDDRTNNITAIDGKIVVKGNEVLGGEIYLTDKKTVVSFPDILDDDYSFNSSLALKAGEAFIKNAEESFPVSLDILKAVYIGYRGVNYSDADFNRLAKTFFTAYKNAERTDEESITKISLRDEDTEKLFVEIKKFLPTEEILEGTGIDLEGLKFKNALLTIERDESNYLTSLEIGVDGVNEEFPEESLSLSLGRNADKELFLKAMTAGEEKINISLKRSYEDGIFKKNYRASLIDEGDAVSYIYNADYIKDAEENLISDVKVLKGRENLKGIGLKSALKVSEDEGTILREASEASISRYEKENEEKLLTFSFSEELKGLSEILEIPESTDFDSLSPLKKAALALKITSQVIPRIVGSIA